MPIHFISKDTTTIQETSQDNNITSINNQFTLSHYSQADNWITKVVSDASDRYKLLTPTQGGIKLNNNLYSWSYQQILDLSQSNVWDTTSGNDYTVALNRAGKDFYIYGCQPETGETPVFILSTNGSAPLGYTTTNSRLIGGFHCLCCSVGNISGHSLTGYLTGDILPRSVWNLCHRPFSSPAGMVYDPYTDWWYDIYLQSGTGASTASAWDATITANRNWFNFREDLRLVFKTFINDNQFNSAAYKSNEMTVLYGVSAITRTGKMSSNKFTGSGINDLSLNRTGWFHTNNNQEYEIEIDATGTPDTFKWRQRNFAGTWGNYVSAVPITGGLQSIADGLTITFGGTTGHTLGVKWSLYIMEAGFDSIGRRMISDIGLESCCGVMHQWLGDTMYSFGSPASHTHSVTVTGDPQTVSSTSASADITPAISTMDPGLSRGYLAIQSPYGYCKLIAGGSYGAGSSAGSLCRGTNYYATMTNTSISCRGASRPKQYG